MADLYIFEANAEDFSTIGLCGALTPSSITFRETGNEDSALQVEHPLDELGRYRLIEEGRIFKTDVPVRNAPEISNGAFVQVVSTYKVLASSIPANRYIYNKKEKGKKLFSVPVGEQVTVIEKYTDDKMRWKVNYVHMVYDRKKKANVAKTETGWMEHDTNTLELVETRSIDPTSEGIEAINPSWVVKAQLFRINSVKMTKKGITAEAQHISYDAKYNLSSFESDEAMQPQAVLDGIAANCFEDCDLELTTNLTGALAGNHYNGVDPITAILDPDTGIVNRWGGKLIRDNMAMAILADCGVDRGIRFEYGKNLTGITYSVDTSDIVTAYRPEGETNDGVRFFLSQSYIASSDYSALTAISGDTRGLIFSPIHAQYPFERIYPLKCSDCKYEKGRKEPTQATVIERMKQQALVALRNGADQPEISVSVDLAAVGSSTAYAKYAMLEKVFLWDYATVYYPPLGRDLTVRIVELQWDGILDRLDKVVLGDLIDRSPRVHSWQLGDISGAKLTPGTVSGVQIATGAITTSQVDSDIQTKLDSASTALSTAQSAVTTANTANSTATAARNSAVVSTITHYLASKLKTGVTKATEGWTTEPQTKTKALKYIWIYYTYVLYNGTTVDSTPTLNGTAQLSVSDAEAQFYSSTSPEVLTGGEWGTEVPSHQTGHYIWSRMRVTYSDGAFGYINTHYDADISHDAELDTVSDAIFDAIDGVGTVWIQAATPGSAVVNDVWLNTSTQKVYRAILVGGAIEWQDITDRGFAKAIIEAAHAADMADNVLETYCLAPVTLVNSVSDVTDPQPGDICMVSTSGVLNQYIYQENATWALHNVPGDVCMIDYGENVYHIAECSSAGAWTVRDAQVGDLWMNTREYNAVYRYTGTTWALVGSGASGVMNIVDTMVDELQGTVKSVQDTATRQASRISSLEAQTQCVSTDEDGLHIRTETGDAEMLLTGAAMHITLSGDSSGYSEFAADYARFGKYKLRLTNDGGMAFIYDE